METKWQFKIGDIGPNGAVIAHIHGHTATVIVFDDNEGRTNIECSSETPTTLELRALERFDYLHARINMLFEGDRRRAMKSDLASAVFKALMSKSVADQDARFRSISHRVASELVPSQLGLASIVAAILAAGLLYAYFAATEQSTREFAALALAASMGAMASITFQLRELGNAAEYFSRRTTAFLGAGRIVSGVLLSLGLLFAVKANLVLGVARDNFWVLMTFMFISGFFERFVVNHLRKIAGPKSE